MALKMMFVRTGVACYPNCLNSRQGDVNRREVFKNIPYRFSDFIGRIMFFSGADEDRSEGCTCRERSGANPGRQAAGEACRG